MNPTLSKYSTVELHVELDHRAKNPTWFIRELVSEGHDLDSEDFCAATDWMDDVSFEVQS